MITRSTRIWTALLLGLCISMVMPPSAFGSQSGNDRPKPQETERTEAQRRDIAKRIVEARLERLRAEQASLEATLAAIEAGQPLEQLRIPDQRWRDEREDPDGRRDSDRDGDRDRGDRRDDDAAGDRFTDAQVLEFIAEVYPEWMPRIRELQERDPEALRGLIRERRPRLIELMIERRENPDVFEARQSIVRSEMRLRRAAWQFARAENNATREEAEAQLEIVLSEQFDQRIELARAELRGVEREVATKQKSIEEAIANRDELIAERKADLLRAIRDRRPPQPGRDGADRPGRPDDRGGPRPGGPPRR